MLARLHRIFASEQRIVALSGLAGFVLFTLSLGLIPLDPAQHEWLMHGDLAVHFTGWALFRASPWTLPVGATPLLVAPVGSSVGLTDSIPLLALPFKALRAFLPEPFQYFGLWIAICWTLQGVFGALLTSQWTERRLLQFLGALLFILSPAVIVRVGHPALSAQWLLLAALWLNFHQSKAQMHAWALVTLCAALIHPYLTAMVLVLAAAERSRAVLMEARSVPRALRDVLLLSVLATLIWWQVGYFMASGGGGLQSGGFGAFSFNLLAPIVPLGTPGGSRLLGAGVATIPPQQLEGYAYLGGGALLLALVAALRWLLVQRSRQPPWARQYGPLAAAAVFFTVFAIGPTVMAGTQTLFQYNPEWWGPLATFRANGRMVWPVYYLVLVLIVGTVARLRLAAPLLVTGIAMQVVDLSGAYVALRDVRSVGYRNPLQSGLWNAAPRHYRRLVLVPSTMCERRDYVDPTPFALLAARHRMALNSGHVARIDREAAIAYCGSLTEEVRQGRLSSDALYVVRPDLVAELRASAPADVICAPIDGYGVCMTRDSYPRWQQEFDVTRSLLPSDDELLRFYHRLEAEYRDNLHRSARLAAGTADERVGLIAMYMAYHASGCSPAEATSLALAAAEGRSALCSTFRPHNTLPSERDMHAFAALAELALLGARRSSETHVDTEGEAVWLHAYAAARLGGLDAARATDAVITRVVEISRLP